MICCREVHFASSCPAIEDVVSQVSQRTGTRLTYIANRWLLVNPLKREDVINLYQEDEHTMILTTDGITSELVTTTLDTLLKMGGYSADWTS